MWTQSTGLATAVVRALDAAGVTVDNIEVRQPSLDDVFFSLTGEHIEEEVVGDGAVARSGRRTGAVRRRPTTAGPGSLTTHELEEVRA